MLIFDYELIFRLEVPAFDYSSTMFSFVNFSKSFKKVEKNPHFCVGFVPQKIANNYFFKLPPEENSSFLFFRVDVTDF